MLDATEKCDKAFDGRFYVGVLSTKIYCLPSCKAKMPLAKNIKFFENRELAESAGLRGCKRCRSEFFPFTQPPWFDDILVFMQSNKQERIREQELMELASVDISTIRRYFKNYLNTTPMVYHRKIRLQYSKELIDQGVDHAIVQYNAGFESLSGFREAFEKEFGILPGEYAKTVRKTVFEPLIDSKLKEEKT
jgi:methylphosphotriester-DNA--protein-cysteine methyltransferase